MEKNYINTVLFLLPQIAENINGFYKVTLEQNFFHDRLRKETLEENSFKI